jgi:5-methylcytosine-specific restriction endonuclease McrA
MGCFSKLAEQMGDVERLAWEEVWMVAKDCSAIICGMPHHKRKRLASALIEDMLANQKGVCPLCGTTIEQSTIGTFHVDHVIPFTWGGGYEAGNLQVTHPSCNLSKGDYVDLRDLVPYLERKAEELGF